jgi:sugar phosphate permease
VRLLRDPFRRRWLIWAALAVVFLLVSLYRLSTAVLADRLAAAFDASATELGTLHASFFVVYAALQLPAGVVADRVGIRWSATAAAVAMNVGALWFALAGSYAGAFAARALVGLGASVIYIAILRFCANWFRADEFATMNGLTVAVAGLGGIVATTPLAVAVAAAGWRTTMLALGAAGLAAAVGVFALARDSPRDADFDDIADVPAPTELTLAEVAANARLVLRDRGTWLVSAALFCCTGVTLTLLGLWGVPYVVQVYDVSVARASVYTLLGSVGLMVGPPLFGWLSDRLRRRTPLMVVGAGLYAATLVVLAASERPPRVVVAAAFFGVAFLLGAVMLGYTVAKERHGSAASGVATGTVNAAAFSGAAVLPPVMGAVLDAYWTGETVAGARVYTVLGYRVAFAIAAAAGLLALACTAWLHARTRDRAPAEGEPASP